MSVGSSGGSTGFPHDLVDGTLKRRLGRNAHRPEEEHSESAASPFAHLIDLVLTKSTVITRLYSVKSVTTHNAKTNLSALLREVAQGAEVEIRRGDRAIARLVPAGSSRSQRRPPVGTRTSGPIRSAPDAFAPLDEAAMKELGLL